MRFEQISNIKDSLKSNDQKTELGNILLCEDYTFIEKGTPNHPSSYWVFKDSENELILNYIYDGQNRDTITINRKVHKLEANKLWFDLGDWFALYEKVKPVNGDVPKFSDIINKNHQQHIRDSFIAKWDSISETLLKTISSEVEINGRIFFALKIFFTGEVYEVKIARGFKGAESYYETFIKEIKKPNSPKSNQI